MNRERPLRDRGAAAVEFALVAGLLIVILFGILDFGRLWMIQSSLSQAAREGAREMAIKNDQGDAELVIEAYPGALGTAVHGVVLPATCVPNATVTAEARAQVETLTGITLNLTGKATMRCGG